MGLSQEGVTTVGNLAEIVMRAESPGAFEIGISDAGVGTATETISPSIYNGTVSIRAVIPSPTPSPTPRTVSVWADPSTVASGEISTIYADVGEGGVQVTFTTNLGIFYESRSDTYSNMTDERGLAIAHLDTTGVSGTATITASEPYGGSSSTQVTISPAITTPTPTPTPTPIYRPGGGVTVDSDGDGYSDSYEIRMGTDPYDRWDYPGASPTPMTVTPSPSPSPSPSPTPPGFEAIFAVAGLLAIAYLVLRRRK